MANHSGYRGIEQTPFGDAARVDSGEAIHFDGNGARGRNGGTGTLGFFGRDLGSDAPTQGRVPAFLGLAERTGGVYVEDTRGLNVADALRQTGLDFEVRKDALSVNLTGEVAVPTEDGGLEMQQQETGEQTRMRPRWVATVGYPNDGGQPFGIAPCSPRYTVIQTGTALEVGDALSEGKLVALGAWDDRAKVYGAWELGDGFDVAGDPYRSFVSIVTTHDGNGTWGVMAPIRLGCTNQTNATFGRKATPRFSIRHVGEARFKLEEARRILGLSKQYVEVLQQESEELLAKPMGVDSFLVFTREVWGVSTDDEALSKRSLSLAKTRDDELLSILASQTCEFGRGTAYAGVQAVIEHLDFYGTVRGGEDAQSRRYERIMAGELDRAKTRAWEMAAAV
jgi:hypothetical protein